MVNQLQLEPASLLCEATYGANIANMTIWIWYWLLAGDSISLLIISPMGRLSRATKQVPLQTNHDNLQFSLYINCPSKNKRYMYFYHGSDRKFPSKLSLKQKDKMENVFPISNFANFNQTKVLSSCSLGVEHALALMNALKCSCKLFKATKIEKDSSKQPWHRCKDLHGHS